MALLEAHLRYRPAGPVDSQPIELGSTDNPAALRVLRDSLLAAAEREYQAWRHTEPGLAAVYRSEVKRLRALFEVMLPEEDFSPNLRLVPELAQPDDAA